MRRFIITLTILGGALVPALDANAADPSDLKPGRTVLWTDRSGVEHECAIINKNSPRLAEYQVDVDPGLFVCELQAPFPPGNFIYITAGKSRIPA